MPPSLCIYLHNPVGIILLFSVIRVLKHSAPFNNGRSVTLLIDGKSNVAFLTVFAVNTPDWGFGMPIFV